MLGDKVKIFKKHAAASVEDLVPPDFRNPRGRLRYESCVIEKLGQ